MDTKEWISFNQLTTQFAEGIWKARSNRIGSTVLRIEEDTFTSSIRVIRKVMQEIDPDLSSWARINIVRRKLKINRRLYCLVKVGFLDHKSQFKNWLKRVPIDVRVKMLTLGEKRKYYKFQWRKID